MDPVQTEIMKNRFTAIAEEAATVAYRTAHTTFVKQTQDFQVAVARISGEFFAYPMLTGVVSGSGQTISGLTQHFPEEELAPGDVLISNDPFSTWGLVTHMMDIHLARPIFVNGKLACFAWSFVHASDIGGAVPGSISPDLFECFQEGLRLRPTKLVKAGVINQDVVNILKDNSRIGDAVWGDLEALMAAMRLLDLRINELCDKVGIEAFHRGVEDVMTHTEIKARRVISALKDGTYTFTDYIEGDDSGAAVHIHCRLTVRGDEAEVDYSGSSPQVHAAFNFATGSRTHPFLCLGLTNYIQTVEPDIPINGGIMRPIKAYAPPGTVMNAEYPAAMGNRFVAVMRTYDALIGCLNQALPNGIAACGAGQAGIISSAWVDPASGRNRVAVVEPFSGGSGGRVRADGVDANDTMIGYLKSTPIEHVEVETPLIVRRHELVPSSFGHGCYRGGAAVAIELESRAPEVTITVRGLDRFRFQPWGVFGGTAGGNSVTTLNPETAPERIGRIKVLRLREKDLLQMISSSGGGFGPPIDRTPDAVLRDVLDEMLTAEEAEAIYGVVIAGRQIDRERTAALRAGIERGSSRFSVQHGPSRRAFEAEWPVDASVALANAALATPPGLRRFIMGKSRAALEDAPKPITPAIVMEAVKRAAGPLD
ncbi:MULTISPECIES: hydantoinase B/oxoprolinase family protein [unclassified Chelatococcus]|uniref:hydantoinase B/oxoprolinase family protein n=1 Tax=unclassified Chelatococcus TaxID=2638111 RepID=UPI001BD09153|nr:MULTISPECIES: hydantoinase B/oxoprolinase family protein [unclassified Chelatococcus]MBS7701101.1 hydantoinase B/oxoprolinase family protein [Chelatococcus sp. YT9]MBX3557232.1 hydantoinase B/oxoprolinase family protein [Chelatococcus sp.]